VDFVFAQDNPLVPDLRFVEVEDRHGRSITIGTWSTREDGLLVLTIPELDHAKEATP
jgi:hypothetical protein